MGLVEDGQIKTVMFSLSNFFSERNRSDLIYFIATQSKLKVLIQMWVLLISGYGRFSDKLHVIF